MRLIDADKVKEYVLTEGFYCDTRADKEATAMEIDELFPTVDAIPIEYIERKIKALRNLEKKNFRCGNDAAALETLLYEYKNE